jgi:Ca2+-binding EF-hand superfamily protein
MNASDPDEERSKLLQGLFDIADQDESGSLDIDELRRIMPDADAFLTAVDTDADSVISMAEFKAWSDANLVLPADQIARLNKLVQLARCGKSLNNGRSVEPQEIFHALDVNGDSELSIDEIKSVFGGDTLQIIGPLVDLLEQKHQALSEADFCEWCSRNHGDYHLLQSGTLIVNKQV